MPPPPTRDRAPDAAADRLTALTRRAYATGQGLLPDHGAEFFDDARPRRRGSSRALPALRWAIDRRIALAALVGVGSLLAIAVAFTWAPWRHTEVIAVPTANEPHDEQPASPRGAEPTSSAVGAPTPPGAAPAHDGPARVFVHVAGAVARPGVVDLAEGARVADALSAAGGPVAGAEVDAINLARVLVDGEQVYVPRVGETLPPAAAAGGAGEGPGSRVVNINSAGPEELQRLPGVGPAIAQRIIDWRTANGGFHTVEELLEVPGIGHKVLEGLRNEVSV
ncbi:MAG TPA: helix-hairpin-helix domain-containing protein [Actinomycetaceae bacterium]|nr:helix-hairpin-helix domain-containing protein [Actinomycetaceae bacterium]